MRVRLYQYNGPSDAANKLEGLTAVYDSINEPTELYGTFSPYAASFTLDRLISCNFALYDFSGIDYFGSVLTTTTADGLYNYQVNIDPLTTAWYRGCMNTLSHIQRNNTPTLFYDPMIPTAPNSNEITINGNFLTPSQYVTSRAKNYRIVMTATTPNNMDIATPTSWGAPAFQTPGSHVMYVFTPVDNQDTNGLRSFANFLTLMQNSVATLSGSSSVLSVIKSVYVVPEYVIPYDGNQVEITLRLPTGSLIDEFTGWNTLTISSVEGTRFVAHKMRIDEDAHAVIDFDVSTIMTQSVLRGNTWSLYIPYVGNISIDPNILIDGTTSIRATVSWNVNGMFYGVRLACVVGSSLISLDTAYTFPITETFAFPRPDGNTNELFGAVTSAIQAVVSAYSGNYAGAATGAISTVSSVLGSYSGATSGVSGGSPDRLVTGHREPELLLHYRPYNVSQNTFAAKYGYPANTVDIIANQPVGYVQTINARLLRNGLPADIVTSAEQQCDSGFRII